MTDLFFLDALLQMDLGVTFLLVGPCELAAAYVAGEWLFAGVRPDVCGEVIGAGEGAHADATLEWLLTGVDANVAGKLVGA